MTLPINVRRFQILLYASLTLDALSVAFQDRSTSPDLSETTVMAASVASACMILLFFYLVGMAVRTRRGWPRWVLLAALVLSMLSLLQVISESGLMIDSLIEIASCILTAAGLYNAFTGDAKTYFNA